MTSALRGRQAVGDEIAGRLIRRHSTAVVLLHRAVADALGLGPTDHKCLDILRERGPMTGSDLAGITGLTTGAITGVVARLEAAGFIGRIPDPSDGRRQTLSVMPERMRDVEEVFAPLRAEAEAALAEFDVTELAAIHTFLQVMTDCIHRQVALMRARTLTS